jgi:hypothetical protein
MFVGLSRVRQGLSAISRCDYRQSGDKKMDDRKMDGGKMDGGKIDVGCWSAAFCKPFL